MNLDAYTIRKIAPRLLFAVIGVNLSIYLCVAAVDITSIVGHGLAHLIRAPFDVAGSLNVTIDQGAANAAAPLLIAGVLIAAIPAFKGGALATIFFLALPIFVLILTVLITIVFRQALLVLLTLISPVAIVLSVLPGTEKYFKQWWDLFLKTLIVYPIIAALFAVSDVLTSVTFNASNVGGNATAAANVITGMLFAFMPLALIPFAFRFAGGALGAFSNATAGVRGMANRFAMSGLQKNWGQGFKTIQGAGLFTNTAKDEEGKGRGIRHRLNRGAARLTNLDKMRLGNPRGSVNRAMENAIMARAKDLTETGEFAALHGFDDEHWANAHSNGSAADIERKLMERAPERFNEDYSADGSPVSEAEKAQRRRQRIDARDQIMNMNRLHGHTVGQAASAVALHGISTSYDTQYMLKDGSGPWVKGVHDESLKDESKIYKTSHEQMQDTIHRVSQGQTGLGNAILAQSLQGAKQAGRYDLAASASANLLYQEALRSGDQEAIDEANKYYKKQMLMRITPQQATQGHVRGAKEVAAVWQEEINRLIKEQGARPEFAEGPVGDVKTDSLEEMERNARRQEASKQLVSRLADMAGFQDAMSGASTEAVDSFDKNILGSSPEGSDLTIGQMMERSRKTKLFAQRRREWGTEAEGEAGAHAAAARAAAEAAGAGGAGGAGAGAGAGGAGA